MLIAESATLNATDTRLRRVILLAVLCDLLILIAYIWLLNTSAWAVRPQSATMNLGFTTYYGQLATSFSHGHLWLETQPNPALLALKDPYKPTPREHIPYLLDMSLYTGRYYVYFGPVPALLLLPIKAVFGGVIGDQYLVLFFLSGILLVETLFVVRLWRRYFAELPPGLVAISLLVMGLVCPFGWVLREANIYNAAILGGQFFLLAGLYTAYDAVESNNFESWKLVLAGVLWALAVGCRITQVLPVAFLVLTVLWAAWRKWRSGDRKAIRLGGFAGLVLALALGAVMLGWYNWARFGSVSETGIKYQLAGNPIQKLDTRVSSSNYVAQNLYNYLLNKPRKTTTFPYWKPDDGFTKTSIAPWISLPRPYSAQPVTGILYTTPFIVLALVPALFAVCQRRMRASEPDPHQSFGWLVACLYGCVLAPAIYLALFFWAAERYLGDFMPALLLLAIIGSWHIRQAVQGSAFARAANELLFVCLAAWSLVVGNGLIIRLDYTETGVPAPQYLVWLEHLLGR